MSTIQFTTTEKVVRNSIATYTPATVEAEIVSVIEDWEEPVTVARKNSMTFAVLDGFGVWCMQMKSYCDPSPEEVVRIKGYKAILRGISNLKSQINARSYEQTKRN